MGIYKKRMTSRDWLDIQSAVSNSDLPNERRVQLLDIIGVALNNAETVEAAAKKVMNEGQI